MNKTTKVILIVSGVLTIGGISVAIYLNHRKRQEENQILENQRQDFRVPSQADNPVNIPSTEIIQEGQPRFNVEGELINPLTELKGKTLYPKAKGDGNGLGYTNVRSTPEVNNDRGWWDFWDNKITTITGSTPIGKVIGEKSSELNGYGYRWLKVWLMNKVGFWGTTEGYVRADTVTFKT